VTFRLDEVEVVEPGYTKFKERFKRACGCSTVTDESEEGSPLFEQALHSSYMAPECVSRTPVNSRKGQIPKMALLSGFL
jgi:hypothetical protein